MSNPSPIRAKSLVRTIGLMPGRRALMLAGVSALALTAATVRVEARMLGGGSTSASAPAAALMAAQAAAMQSAQQATASIRRATQALQSIQQIQQQARNAASQTSSGIPNGLAVNGLEPDSGLGGNALASWTGVAGLVQSQAGGRTNVDILQSQPKAILNWKTFNVGSSTTVNFNQAGTDWVALNRIDDNGKPSQILGQINAPGSVYLINRNGIIFGGGSQVNVTGLIASSLDVGSLGMTRQQRDQFFLNNGIASKLSFSISSTADGGDANTKIVGGDIRVDAGATITTALNAQDSPGFVYLFGVNVFNNGTIISPAGEVGMVAARTVTLTPGSYRTGVLDSDVTFRGTGFSFSNYAPSYDSNGNPISTASVPGYLPGTGTVTQGGLLATPRGTALLTGDKIIMSGVISADTSVTRNSIVLLDAVTSTNLSGTISIQPYENGDTLPFLNGAATANTSSNVQAFIPGIVFMGGYDVTMAGTGLISAPSARVTLRASHVARTAEGNDPTINFGNADLGIVINPSVDTNAVAQSVLLAPGATIDVAGLQNVQLPASYNFIAYQPTNNDFADTPLQRDGVLVGQTLWIDIRASGKRSDGTTWLGTPLGNANGYVNNVPQSIDVLMTKGGTVSLSTDVNQASLRNVVLQPGSLINVAGGSVQYLPGSVPVTILIGADGRRYSMDKADPNMTYVGIAGRFTVYHPARYSVSETFSSGGTRNESGYAEGRDAGGISIATVNPVLDGDFLFGAISGERQLANGKQASGTLANGAPSQNTPYELPSQGYLSLTTAASVVIDDGSSAAMPPNFIPTDLYTSNAPFRTDLSAARLSGYHLSALIITASDLTLTKGIEIDMALGGRALFTTAGAMDLQGNIVAHSGQIGLKSDGSLTGTAPSQFKLSKTASGAQDIRISGTLDTSGLWVNDTGITTPGLATGSAFIDGGNISISTVPWETSVTGKIGTLDATGNIILGATSVLDASSGGYVGVNGKIKTSAYQVPSGKGGNITLAVYQGLGFGATGGPVGFPALKAPDANVEIDPAAVLRSYGFTSNGQLLIAVPRVIQIGGQPDSTVNFWLPASFFNAGGFSKYTIQSVADGHNDDSQNGTGPVNINQITLAANETLILRQRNFSMQGATLSDLPTGTSIGQAVPLVTLADDQRAPTSLTLGSDYILLDTGSKIIADSSASASVSLRGTQNAPTSTLPISYGPAISTLLLGQIISHGGTVNVAANRIWLGSQALIDVSGALVANSTFGQVGSAPVSGTLLNGGNVNLTFDAGIVNSPSSSLNSYLIGQSGARIDVSGAAATLQGIGSSAPVDSWSDGGTLSISTRTLLWDGTFSAKAGAPQGNDGTLILGGGQVYLAQSDTSTFGSGNLSAALKVATPTSANYTLNSNIAAFAPQIGGTGDLLVTVDKLSEFGTIYLYSGNDVKPAQYFSILKDSSITSLTSASSNPLTLQTVGNINWNVGQRLYLGAQAIAANAPAAANTVTISAPYVLLTTYGQSTSTAATGSGSLTVIASTIDVEGAVFSGYSSVNLNSTGDIRLSTPRVFEANGGTTTNPDNFTGTLTAPASLTLQAQRIYPVTDVDFTIKATAVTFARPADSSTDTPLSAGGSVTVVATTINQDGNLFAPLGKIVLGDSTAQTVTLGRGSLTSVSLGDTVVPFGETQDGIDWFYNDPTNPLSLTATATTFLPTKSITLNGQNVTLQSNSTVDVRGGGDLLANEFVAGKGGSVDTLAQPNVYALLPSNSAAVAAFDIDFIYRLGDTQPLAGRQVYLAGGNGIAAGTYTLLPAHYATLPGALRIVDYGSALAKPGLAGRTLADNTQIMGGYYTQSTNPGGRSSGTELFAVQTNAVWRQYSEITSTSANSYFSTQAIHDGVNIPYLPIDAGRLAISAQKMLTMHETALSTAVGMGRPGQLDLSANQIALIAPGQTAPGGYLGIDVTQINGFGSVLIGGLRSDLANGDTAITAVASQVVVDTQGFELTAPEIILVAAPSVTTNAQSQVFTYVQTGGVGGTPTTKTVTLNYSVSGPADAGSGNITVKSGSIIDATGLTGNTFSRHYVPAASVTAQDIVNLLGGSLDSTGTIITGADITKLQNPSAALLAALLNYSGSQQFGAMLALTSDPLLSFGTLSATNNPALTINFGSSTVTSSSVLVLPAGNGNSTGSVTIAANAVLRGQAATLSATASTAAMTFDPAARFDVTQINLVAKNFALGTGVANAAAVAMTSAVFDHLAAGHVLSLKAFNGGIDFYGDVTLDQNRQSLGVTLDAPFLAGHGGTVAIDSGGTVTLLNSGLSAATTSQTVNAGTSLTLNAGEIDLGGGSQVVAGFASVAFNADSRVFAKKQGLLQLGLTDASGKSIDTSAIDLAITTPDLLVAGATSAGSGTGSQFLFSTRGNVTVSGGSGEAPSATTENGGFLEIDANSFALSSTIQVQAGTLAIHTTGTDSAGNGITLKDGAYIAAGGAKQSFFDSDQYLPGGKVTLTADTGNVFTAVRIIAADGSIIAAGSVVDVAQPVDASGHIGLGYGGEFDITATVGSVALNGVIKAAGAPGHGGIFNLDTRTLLTSLDTLADSLLNGGVTGEIDIHTRRGNLTLSQGHILQAHSISLTADAVTLTSDPSTGPDTTANGNLTIAGIIDARGEDAATADGTNEAGGQVGLWGANSVRLASTGVILASTTHADERGGDVSIGVGWNAPWDYVNHIGGINLEVGSRIDVSGGSKGGLGDGTVTLRAPEDGHNDVKIQQIGSTIRGARAVHVEGYVSFDTAGGSNGIDGSIPATGSPRNLTVGSTDVTWDGIVDPAGWFNSNGTLVAGKFTGLTGWKINLNAGTGYTAPPTIVLTTLAGTTGTVITSLEIASFKMTLGAGLFSQFPTLTFPTPNTPGLPGGGTQATGSVVATIVTGIASATAGVTLTAVSFTGSSLGAKVVFHSGGGTFVGTPIISGGKWTGVTVTNGGSFTAAPDLTFDLVSSAGTVLTTTTGKAIFKLSSFTLTNAGEGYTAPATPTFAGQITAPGFTLSMGVAARVTDPGLAVGQIPTGVSITGGNSTGTKATATITAVSNLTGMVDGAGNFTPDAADAGFTLLTTNGTASANGTGSFAPTIVNTAHSLFFTSLLELVAQGNWNYIHKDKDGNAILDAHGNAIIDHYGLSAAQTRLGSYTQSNGQGVISTGSVHVQPGIQLVNSNTTVNSGDITVLSNWNLAAGTVYNADGTKLGYDASGNLLKTPSFYTASDSLQFLYRFGLEPGTLTLRAVRDVNIDASISDGFFQFYNYNSNDPTYLANLAAYITGAFYRSIGLSSVQTPNIQYYLNGSLSVPVAPYDPTANQESPTAAQLNIADVFPNTICTANCGTANAKGIVAPGSWSYRVTAGADIGSANPNATASLASFGDHAAGSNAGHGNVVFDKHGTYNASVYSTATKGLLTVPVNIPTMLRTGTGSIDIAAARDLELNDKLAPGVIYTAGVNTALLTDPQSGFVEPKLLLQASTGSVFAEENAAAFPQMAGDITITVRQDVIGFQNVQNPGQAGPGSTLSFAQFYSPWLLSTAEVGLQNSNFYTLSLGAGVFTPTGTRMMEQSAWWIQFSAFDQGVMSVGGNVTLTAGRDVRDFSVSLPTTGRVSGGLSVQLPNGQLNTPVTHLYGSGNLTVNVGRSLASGSFYEGSGHASIEVRGSVISDWQSGKISVPTILAVDSGQIALTAGGAISVGVVNPAQLQMQDPSVLGTPYTYTLETYGADSAVRLFAGSGDISFAALPASFATASGGATLLYPSTLEAVAFSGSINLAGNIVLADSLSGGLDLLANANIVLNKFTVSTGASLIDGAFNAFAPNNGFDAGTSKPMLAHSGDDGINRLYAVTGSIYGGTGQANDANDPSTSVSNLFSSNRAIAVRAGGDIVDFNLVAQNVNLDDVSSVIAGHDISYSGKYNFGGLQIAGPGFLLVEAGRDLGPFLPLAFDTSTLARHPEGIQSIGNNGELIQQGQIVGPVNANSANFVPIPILSRFPVGNWQSDSAQRPAAPPNPEFLGAPATLIPTSSTKNGITCSYLCFTGMNNFLLPTTGASIVSMFGVSKGINYQGVIDGYINPARTSDFTNYLPNFTAFLVGSGKFSYATDSNTLLIVKDARGLELPLFDLLDPATQQVFLTQIHSDSPAQHIPELRNFLSGRQFDFNKVYWPVFNSLSAKLQDLFVVDLFSAHLKAVGETDNVNYQKYQVGYQMIDTLFPSAFGYTKNGLDGGTNGANQLVRTGDLNLLHATIQTQRGGDISVLGPGGSIFVGSVAKEPNTSLKLGDLGLLTLSGGAINTFSDASVLVNASRVMTWFGGDIVMWSSNGDIDAGRGAKTTLSFPPLGVDFNQDDLETVDLGGSVSGAGIAVLQTQSFASKSDAFLLAPRGKIDAGDAGIRVSGNLSLLAVQVLNAYNIQVQGKTTGVPTVAAPNVAGLTAANNAAGAGAKTATPTADKPADRPSVIIVEVVGYGGGDGADENPSQPKKPKPADDRQGYNPNGNVRVLGYSALEESEMVGLTEKEKQAIRN